MTWLFAFLFSACLTKNNNARTSASTIVIKKPKEILLNKPRSGTIRDGVFRDETYPFQGVVPDGWVAEMGPIDGAMRLRMKNESLGTVVEMWRFVDILDQPAPRSDCDWAFVDKGRYAIPKNDPPLLVGTCLSRTADGMIVFGVLRPRPQGTWQFEIHSPSHKMLESKREGERILKGFEWVLADGTKPALPQID